jgi:hypothetical protein
VLSYAQEIATPDENIIDLGRGWYEATAYVEYHEDITKAQAKEKALSRALKKIIEFYSGVEVSSTSLSILAETNLEMDLDHFSQLTSTMSSGMILEKKILEGKLIGSDFYTVTLKAKVGKLEGENDPLFKLEADLNRESYQNGDEMIINISSSKDCYIYVFNILSDETVSALLPNQYLEENYLAKGTSIRVPPVPPEKGKKIKFWVDLPEGKSQATEMILVLGIKADKDTKSKDFDLNIGDYKMALTQLMEFIMGFPRDRVEQVNLPYVIQKKDE